MEGKVLLYDSNDNRIGETFVRRAKQLVKQQRASWTDDSQSAIRFAPGMERMDDPADTSPLSHGTERDEALLKLAKRRVHARFGFKLHRSIAIALSVFLIMIYMLTDRGGYFWPVWPIMALGLGIVIHWVVYKNVSVDNMSDKIAREYEQLKHEYGDFK